VILLTIPAAHPLWGERENIKLRDVRDNGSGLQWAHSGQKARLHLGNAGGAPT